MKEKLYGLHPVTEALRSDKRRIERLYLAEDKLSAYRQLIGLARKKQIPVRESSRRQLNTLLPGVKHQGAIALTGPLPTLDLEDLVAGAWERGEEPFLLLADSVQDPHNLGAIIRSAEAVGVHGLILSRRHTVGLTPSVARVAAGAMEHLPIALVNSPADCLQRLKDCGFWRVGLHPAGERRYDELDLKLPLVILIGGEGVGLRPGLRRHCDWLAYLPQRGQISSLNTSVAAAVMLYEVRRQRG